MPECRLCRYTALDDWEFPGDRRSYLYCRHCYLVQVTDTFLPGREEARLRYTRHADGAGNEGHVAFLMQAIQPSLPFIRPEWPVLDFGCGPVPVLESLLSDQGLQCDSYDPYFGFQMDENKNYGHIFCLETAEHFLEPAADWHEITRLLKPQGTLTLMTERYRDKVHFSDWYYKRDITHVVFYHEKTIRFLTAIYPFEIMYDDGKRVTLFRKTE